MKLDALVNTHLAVAERSGRLDKIERLAALLALARGQEIGIVAAYLTGKLPQGRIGLGPAAIRSALATTSAREATLTLSHVDEIFTRIASTSGKGSGTEKGRLLHALMSEATEPEQRFLSRLLVGELRQGALEGVMVDALARAADVDARLVRRALMTAGDYATVARAALVEGREGLSRFAIQLFRPVQPMLAQPAESPGEALADLEDALLEYKLDGARIQVHKDGDDVRVYSRRLREVTQAVPEVVVAARALPLERAILDGEVIALRADGAPHPFQVTMRRFGRKLEVETLAKTLPLTPFIFDVLYADGEDLCDAPLSDRTRVLEEAAGALLMPRVRASDVAAAGEFLRRAIAEGHEGIMAKSLASVYEAGSRGRSWIKIKPTHTLDLVVLAAEWGHGRRKGKLSNLHLGARDPVNGGFVMLGKTFKGMTDAVLAWQTEQLLARQIGREGIVVHVRPELVAEIAFNDVQESPHYPGGLALRFARLKRYRDDKTADEADTIDTVRALHAGRTGT